MTSREVSTILYGLILKPSIPGKRDPFAFVHSGMRPGNSPRAFTITAHNGRTFKITVTETTPPDGSEGAGQ